MTEMTADIVHDAGGGSRRTFLAGAAGLAVGAGGLAAAQSSGAVPFAGAATAAEQVLEAASAPTGALVAYVRDLAAGEIAVMRGDSEVVVIDHGLARALARLAG